MHHSFQVFSHKNVNDLTAVQILLTTPETVTSDVTIQNVLVCVLDWITRINNACIIHVPRAISMQYVALVHFYEHIRVFVHVLLPRFWSNDAQTELLDQQQHDTPIIWFYRSWLTETTTYTGLWDSCTGHCQCCWTCLSLHYFQHSVVFLTIRKLWPTHSSYFWASPSWTILSTANTVRPQSSLSIRLHRIIRVIEIISHTMYIHAHLLWRGLTWCQFNKRHVLTHAKDHKTFSK